MNAQPENDDTVQTSVYDPFPEPQTIPAGWDTSEFYSAAQPVAVEQEENSTEG